MSAATRSRTRLWVDMAGVTWDLCKGSPLAAAALILVILVGNSVGGVMAAAMGGFVDAALHGGRGMAFWLGLYVAATLVEQFYWNFKTLAVGYMRDHGLHRLQGRILRRAAAVSLRRFEERAFYDGLQRASTDLSNRLHLLIYSVADLGQLVVATGAVAVVVGLIRPVLLVVLAAGTIPAVWLNARVASAVYRAQREHSTADRIRGHLQGLLTGREAAAEVRLFGAADYLLGRWRDLRLARTRDTLAAEARTGAAATAGNLLSGLAYAASLLLVAGAILHGRLSVGNYVTIAGAALGFAERLGILISHVGGFDEQAQFLGDLSAFLRWMQAEEPEEEGAPAAPSPAERAGRRGMEVAAAGITFTYPTGDGPALRGVDVRIAPGERIAIVGENGAGKSTLAKLLVGLYAPDAGTVRLDGLPPVAARRRIAAVFQDHAIYQLRLRENVGFGDTLRLGDNVALQNALVRADIADLTDRLPGGLEAYLGREFGETDLSGGQWQRIALARAFFRDADLLVLDEPTAALDPLAELALFERFAELTAGRTAVMISHRLGAARLADRILVVAGGRVVEDGSHDDLVARGGAYARLFAAQAQWYRPGPVG